MADHSPQRLIQQWQSAMEAAVSGAAGHVPVPQPLVALMERQIELVQEVVEREQRVQREVLTRAFGPLDAVFDLLEQSAQMLRGEADALEASARALEHAAELMRAQSELSARTISALRGPTRLAESVAGIHTEKHE